VYKLLSECRPGYLDDELCVSGPESTNLMKSIAVALAVKGVMTIVTFGIKVPAGIFIPTLGGNVSLTCVSIVAHLGSGSLFRANRRNCNPGSV
jgi:H+/Cl- antiporter ClcA